mmetsp:Transcript_2104/g.2828  ORF Transcript_2104/g.2828 Transcript_2104/m.2828 type:complete len:102 (+) Transcript_2104:1625-1930(+)
MLIKCHGICFEKEIAKIFDQVTPYHDAQKFLIKREVRQMFYSLEYCMPISIYNINYLQSTTTAYNFTNIFPLHKRFEVQAMMVVPIIQKVPLQRRGTSPAW